MRIELENRLVKFAQNIDELCLRLEKYYQLKHLVSQLRRSSSSAALNYGEAQAAESRNDFIHKISVLLKELKETKIILKLLLGHSRLREKHEVDILFDECDQLSAIFYKTIMTSKSNSR
jgi:four helix bundle protein